MTERAEQQLFNSGYKDGRHQTRRRQRHMRMCLTVKPGADKVRKIDGSLLGIKPKGVYSQETREDGQPWVE